MRPDNPLTRNIRPGGPPPDLRAYEQAGGYTALRRALLLAPAKLVQLIKDADLRGRGGAGFPAGMKWDLMPPADTSRRPRYLVVNADEMEPGTFKDRYLIEGDPHQLLEGIICAAHAVQADAAFVFLRWAYAKAEWRLRRALDEAREAGYLGRDILGSGYDLDVHLHVSAGRYMCGEETGLLNAMAGKRAQPRAKPPFPTVVGLWGKPTVVNNVETLCNVPHIVLRGADWFRDLGHGDESGTKIYGVSGRVRRPGTWELPMGTPMRELIEEHAGGMLNGYRFRAALPGGASTSFLVSDQLDVPLGFDGVRAAGGRFGTGSLVVLDDRTCAVGLLRNLEAFFARESCGWCTPCREGLPWVEGVLAAMERGEGQPSDIDLLEHHCHFLGMGYTFCALAPGAMAPLQSALTHFRDEFERHVRERRCPLEAAA